MLDLRNTKTLYTKEAPAHLVPGHRHTSEVQLKRATTEELRKELGATDVNNLPEGYVAGWASTNDLDHYGDVIVAGAFVESITKKGLKGPRGIKFLNQHKSDQPAGHIIKLEQRSGGLWIEAQLNLAISYVRDLYEASKVQGGLNFSVGYRLVDDGFDFIDKGADSYWLITKADLHEVSVVTFPGNDAAEMIYIKNDGDNPFDTVAEAEKALVASGFCKTRREANRFTKWLKGLGKAQPPEPDQPVLASTLESVNKASDALAALKKSLTFDAKTEN